MNIDKGKIQWKGTFGAPRRPAPEAQKGSDSVRTYKQSKESALKPARKILEKAESASTSGKPLSGGRVDPLHGQENIDANRRFGTTKPSPEVSKAKMEAAINSRTKAASSLKEPHELLRLLKKRPIFESDSETTVLTGDLSNKSIEELSKINDYLDFSSDNYLTEFGNILTEIEKYDTEIAGLRKSLKPSSSKEPKIPGLPTHKLRSIYDKYKSKIADRKADVHKMLKASAATKIQAAFRGKRERMLLSPKRKKMLP
ncbi:MAG: hypothetical protein HN411_02550 [Waddliaceae bacterium]|jgi:hypothetical protein|nr:hypothetical protein [Waddliaceae bacterium]MBT3578707.1 hypothetical protein [Waddliaceae bacterium]MBT4444391.1 hypothetical protein [Waddliaceae bacterium]MBT6928306.1 hypothetical protein [Waddliaceae bacterium]MBT7264992.1 hypothetical protein [Waddliaceae bacterium]